jgi:hypothetical protein
MNQLNWKKRNLLLCTDDLLQRYETLRSQVLKSPSFDRKSGMSTSTMGSMGSMGAMGYVLFLRRGMLIWMENCSTYILEPEVQPPSKLANNNYNYSEFPDPLKKQIVFALTNIIISHQRRLYEGK